MQHTLWELPLHLHMLLSVFIHFLQIRPLKEKLHSQQTAETQWIYIDTWFTETCTLQGCANEELSIENLHDVVWLLNILTFQQLSQPTSPTFILLLENLVLL